MSKTTIEWTEKTWNPITGCTFISKECLNCYAVGISNRLKKQDNYKYRNGFEVVTEHPYTLKHPFTWRKPCTVFVNSMADTFHKDVSKEFREQLFKVMNETPQHTYQILTKRHHILAAHANNLNWSENIWMGVSVGSNISKRKIKSLVECGAKNKFLSIEPLIEEIKEIDLTGIDWVIVGGESGFNSRVVKKEWIVRIKDICNEQSIPFFFKQWGNRFFNPDKSDPTLNFRNKNYAKGGCQIDGEIFRENPTIK